MRLSLRYAFVAFTMSACGASAFGESPTGAARALSADEIPAFTDRSASSTYKADTRPPSSVWWVGDETLAMNRFYAVGGADLITTISIPWYVAANDSPARVFIWQDPTGAGDPRAAVLLHEQSVQVANSGSGAFTAYTLTKPVSVSGFFYVGVAIPTTTYTLAGDANTSIGAKVSYLGGTASPPIDAANLATLPYLVDVGGSTESLRGAFLIRAGGNGSAFSYQGRLANAGQNYTGNADFIFTVYDSQSGGEAVGSPVAIANVPVSAGVFSVQIPSDPSWFVNAPDRYLEVQVRTPADGGAYSTITPRGRIGQVPAAMVATLAQSAQTVPWSGVTDVPASVTPWAPVANGIAYSGTNVGIGTTSPQGRLHVSGGPLYRNLDVDSSNPEGTWFNLMNIGTNGRIWSLISTGSSNTEGAGALLIRDSSVSAVRATFLPNGNVGIGTITPAQALDVNGSIATSGSILFGNRQDDLVILNGAPGGPNFALGITPNTLRIHTATNAQFISFGYGSAATYTQTASISGAGNLTIIGNGFKPGGGSWAASCDPRLKHDITPMAGTLERLLSLRGYRFVYNDDAVLANKGLPGVQIGLMADEVERVFPDWVSRDKDGMRMVTERSTTALMVEALRDLRAEKDGQIAELKSRLERVEHLEKENALLRERLERIEKALAR